MSPTDHTHSRPLAPAARALRTGNRDPVAYVEDLSDRIATVESTVQAWVDGPRPRPVLTAGAAAIERRYPDPADRPPLFGIPVGIKDVFHVAGLPTRAGSDLPPGVLAGPQATVVSALREAGALVMGKTVTTEFAYFDPGPTRNPHDPAHTPGGSSSGSAAAVAAGTTPLAVGTQTIGSVIRPAAYCGVVGFKPSYGRIPVTGTIPLAPSVDHVGLFTQDVAGMCLAARACIDDWTPTVDDGKPTLGVPAEEYCSQATPVGHDRFQDALDTLRNAGYELRQVDALTDIESINDRHERIVAAEAAQVHHEWFDRYGDRYSETTAGLIRDGRAVTVGDLAAARGGREALRTNLGETMDDHGIDLWVAPAATGPAPAGIDSTGDPVLNLPWTHAGLPTAGLPAGDVDGRPVGVQCVGRFGADERLLGWAETIADDLETVE